MRKWKKTAQNMHKNKKNRKKKRQTLQQKRKLAKKLDPNIAVGQVRDMNSRTMFKDPVLCAQFLREHLDIPFFKDIRPEDISDVSEKYQAYLGISFETDSVKKIQLHDENHTELFMVSLIEHKSQVDYNVSMQLLRYMVCIWTEYGREMERKQEGIIQNKSFRYPPILPIVYYEGKEKWTASRHLKDRIQLEDVFGEYFPDFTYKLVRIHDYTNEELLDKENEMSLLMMINRIQTPEDITAFLAVEPEKVRKILKKALPPELEIIVSTLWSLCMKLNVSVEEATKYIKKVREQNMGYLFENMEKMDIQEERRKTAEAQKELDKARNETREAKNEAQKGIILVCRKYCPSKETAAQELMNACGLNQEEAQKQVDLYW